MPELAGYSGSRSVEQAISDAADRKVRPGSSISKSELIRQAHYDRFLCRVFVDGLSSIWMLKGGSGLLARLGEARATRDIDLFAQQSDLALAVKLLEEQAQLDMGDYFRFRPRGRELIVGSDLQPRTSGVRVVFDVFCGVKQHDTLSVDVVITDGIEPEPELVEPLNRLELPKLVTVPYVLYPVAQQLVEKIAAIAATYRDRPSTRTKDLVDVVAIATNFTLEAASFGVALRNELERRNVAEHIVVPREWKQTFERESAKVPACSGLTEFDAACGLLASLANPPKHTAMWDPHRHEWTP